MSIQFSFLLYVLVVINFSNSLTPSDVCTIDETECIGKYDANHNYVEECEKVKCSGKYAYQCNPSKCTLSKKSCDTLKEISFSMRSFRNLRMYQTQLGKYQDFIKRIKKCPSAEKKLHPDDLCINGDNCFFKQTLRLKNAKINVIKEAECPCRANHTFHCAKNFCSTHKTSCSLFTNSLQLNLIKVEDLKPCYNDNTLLSRNFLFV